MSYSIMSVLSCDAEDCHKFFKMNGTSKRNALWDKASLADWRVYSKSHFCPECWIKFASVLNPAAASGKEQG